MVMFRKNVLIYTLLFCSLCILLLWYFSIMRRPTSVQKPHPISLRKSEGPDLTTLKPATPTPLPKLMLEAQDSFYGFGCKENRYRKNLQELLNEWTALTLRRNITQYFICFGSLLGSVRNGDMVPYDSDIDVCMFRDDYYKLDVEEANRPLDLNDGKIHLLLQRHSPNPKDDIPRMDCLGNIVRSVTDDCAILDPHARMFISQFIYMDIFMLDDLKTLLWDEYRDKLHDRDTVLPIKHCKFLGLDTKCPNDADKYLKVYYGEDYMAPHHKCKKGEWKQNMIDAVPAFV